MKYIKKYERVSIEEKEIMYKIRLALNNFFKNKSTSVSKNTVAGLIYIKIYSGPKNANAKKFLDVMEYIGMGRKLTFYATIDQLKELLDIFKSYRVDQISSLMTNSKKYNL